MMDPREINDGFETLGAVIAAAAMVVIVVIVLAVIVAFAPRCQPGELAVYMSGVRIAGCG